MMGFTFRISRALPSATRSPYFVVFHERASELRSTRRVDEPRDRQVVHVIWPALPIP